MMPSLDLIAIHHSGVSSTREFVRTELAELERLSAIGPAQILLVDNGPTGDVAELGELPGVELVPAPGRQGFGANVTFAAQASAADLLLMLNVDARIDAASIEILAHALERPGVGAVGPRIIDPDGRPSPSAWHFPDLLGVACFAVRQERAPWVQSDVSETTAVDVMSGAAMMLRRETFLGELGGFDPGYFMFSEDADLCRRLEDHGLERLIVPSARAVHAGQASTRGHERRRDVEQWRSRSTYWRKHHGLAERAAIRALYSLAYAAGAMLALLRGPRRAAFRRRSRRLLFLAGAAIRTPRGPGLAELAAEWSPPAPGPGAG